MENEIKCPKCSYNPVSEDSWVCTCNQSWNTFDTAGKCPKCKKQWEDTQCPNCHRWSKHLDWYIKLDKKLQKNMQEITEVRHITTKQENGS